MAGPAVRAYLETLGPVVRTADPRLEPLGEGAALVASLTRLEAGTRRCVWNMQARASLSVLRPTLHLDAATQNRGIEQRMVWATALPRQLPLLTSLTPLARYGPVATPMILIDERYVIVPTRPGTDTPLSAFGTDDPSLVRLARDAFLETWDRSVTWDVAGLRAPLVDRRLRLTLLLVDGCTDREIADALGISERTVSAEVRAVVDWLGARNRTHAVAMLVGAA